MKEIEFNLLTEPWVRVRRPDNTVQEVSLTDALLHAQDYVDLAGEMPTQDAAVLRLLLAVLFTVIVGIVNVVYVLSPFGKQKAPEKTLKITIPEDLEYDGVFDDVLARYTDEHELVEVQTTNMGSLFLLEYAVRMKAPGIEKRMIDEVRCLNGNLKVVLGSAAASKDVL